jgi:hypothetical protein
MGVSQLKAEPPDFAECMKKSVTCESETLGLVVEVRSELQ